MIFASANSKKRKEPVWESARLIRSDLIFFDDLQFLFQEIECPAVVNCEGSHDREHREDEDDGETALSRAVAAVVFDFRFHFLKL